MPSLAALIPKIPDNQVAMASKMAWIREVQSFCDTWKKVDPRMSKHNEFALARSSVSLLLPGLANKVEGVPGKLTTAEVLKILGQSQPQAIERVRSRDKARMMADTCEDSEPFYDEVRKFVEDYDVSVHKSLEGTRSLYEVDDGLFWKANFDIVAPVEFRHFINACGHAFHGKRNMSLLAAPMSPAEVAEVLGDCSQGITYGKIVYKPVRQAAVSVYSKWLEAMSMPSKANIAKILMQQGLFDNCDQPFLLDIHENSISSCPFLAPLSAPF
jgi:hypothetical protein